MRKKEREMCEFEVDFKKSFFVAALIKVMMTLRGRSENGYGF